MEKVNQELLSACKDAMTCIAGKPGWGALEAILDTAIKNAECPPVRDDLTLELTVDGKAGIVHHTWTNGFWRQDVGGIARAIASAIRQLWEAAHENGLVDQVDSVMAEDMDGEPWSGCWRCGSLDKDEDRDGYGICGVCGHPLGTIEHNNLASIADANGAWRTNDGVLVCNRDIVFYLPDDSAFSCLEREAHQVATPDRKFWSSTKRAAEEARDERNWGDKHIKA